MTADERLDAEERRADPTAADPSPGQRSELGDFLRQRRERLQPQDAGLNSRRARRTPGLRREEVAELAGIGVDWYVRLEQGRRLHPSARTVEALVSALRLTPAEAAHLRRLSQMQGRAPFVLEQVPEALSVTLHGLPQPAYLTGRRWDLLAWNAAADALFGLGQLAADERNILSYILLDVRARALFGSHWSRTARRMVAQFRATFDLFADDPAFGELRSRLQRESPEFSGWWSAHEVRPSVAGQKVLVSDAAGTVTYQYVTFQSNDDPDIKLALYTRLGDL